MYRPNLKSVSFSVPGITESTQKFGQKNLGNLSICPRSLFSKFFSWASVRMNPVIVLAKFEVRSLTHSRDNSDWTFGWGANTQCWGRGGRRWSGMVPFESAKVSSYWLPILNFKRYCRFCAPERHFFHPTSSLPSISPCSSGSRWMAFGLQRAMVLG